MVHGLQTAASSMTMPCVFRMAGITRAGLLMLQTGWSRPAQEIQQRLPDKSSQLEKLSRMEGLLTYREVFDLKFTDYHGNGVALFDASGRVAEDDVVVFVRVGFSCLAECAEPLGLCHG